MARWSQTCQHLNPTYIHEEPHSIPPIHFQVLKISNENCQIVQQNDIQFGNNTIQPLIVPIQFCTGNHTLYCCQHICCCAQDNRLCKYYLTQSAKEKITLSKQNCPLCRGRLVAFCGCHDIPHNDTHLNNSQHCDTQLNNKITRHSGLNNATLSTKTL